jgi:hypothetical protein
VTRRPSACPEGHPVRRKGERWWCWTCDREVEPRDRPTVKLTRTRIASKGPGAKRTRTRERHYGSDERMAWLHGLPCVAQGAPGHVCDPWDMETGRAVIQAVHVRARGAGGTADDQVPGCAAFHREAGELGTTQRRSCEARYGLDLVARAADYAAQWRAVDTSGATC